MTRNLCGFVLFQAALFGCSGGTGGELAGSWRILQETVYFDAGGSTGGTTPVSRNLDLSDVGWTFGSSGGTYAVAPIVDDDWLRWGVDSYGPSRKLELNGWNADFADGPIEETAEGIDYLWVIYHVDSPDPGTVWMKLGRQ